MLSLLKPPHSAQSRNDEGIDVFFQRFFKYGGALGPLEIDPHFVFPKPSFLDVLAKLKNVFFMNILKNQTFFLKIFSKHVLKKIQLFLLAIIFPTSRISANLTS